MNAVNRKRGRPSLLTREVIDTLCERLADSESLRSICRSPDMPSTQSVRAWLKRGSQEQEGRYRDLLAHYA